MLYMQKHLDTDQVLVHPSDANKRTETYGEQTPLTLVYLAAHSSRLLHSAIKRQIPSYLRMLRTLPETKDVDVASLSRPFACLGL